MIVLKQGTWSRCIALSVAVVILSASGAFAQDLLKEITENGLLKAIQKGENIYEIDPMAKGVQLKREKDWNIFFDEANRAYARIGADPQGQYLGETYRYLVQFFRGLADDMFREAFLKNYPNIKPFNAETALRVSLNKAKEGSFLFDKPLDQAKHLIEWYESLSTARNLAVKSGLNSINLDNEKDEFASLIQVVIDDMKAKVQDGEAGKIASHIRALGLNFSMEGITKHAEMKKDFYAYQNFNNKIHQALLDYSLSIAVRDNISTGDKLDTLAEAAVALLDLRKNSEISERLSDEAVFTSTVDRIWNDVENSDLSELQKLELELKEILIKDTIGAELWLGKVLPAIDKQEEPKPYKLALAKYRVIADRALDILNNEKLNELDTINAELIALEAQSWVSQLIQDMGIVFSADFNFEQAAIERDRLLAIRHRVENNPKQTSGKAFDLIQKARLHEIEFYKYQEKPKPLMKAIELVDIYAPQVLPSLDKPIPDPESNFCIKAGVCMLIWKAMALDHSGQYDEAEVIFNRIVNLYSDRYRYPDPWCFSFVDKAKLYLHFLPEKRAKQQEEEEAK